MQEDFLNGRVTLHSGDCRDVIRHLPDNSIDSVVTDPPYALVSIVKRFGGSNMHTSAPEQPPNRGAQYKRLSKGFMGKQWDTGETAFSQEFWSEVLRVLKPGGHVAAFGGTRTQHRMVCAIDDAGFEIRDTLSWNFASGFPKSHNVGNGFGTALKPAMELICLARKPLSEGTVAANGLRWSTGALNIDGCRIATSDKIAPRGSMDAGTDIHEGWSRPWMADKEKSEARLKTAIQKAESIGRWPANVIHDGSDEVVGAFPDTTSGTLKAGTIRTSENKVYGKGMAAAGKPETTYDQGGDSGSAARFFYSAKADSDDRLGSKHPTVKPVDLMQWLCRLITPPGGTVLDPFAGTGATAEAAYREGFNAVLVEREAEYQADIRRRMALTMSGPDERRRESIKAKIGDLPFGPGSLFAGLCQD